MATRVKVGTTSDFTSDSLVKVDADGTSVIVARDAAGICAARNHCPHLGLSLTSGPGGSHYADGVVQCQWHGSRFELRTGENVDWVVGVGGKSMPRWSRRLLAMGKKPSNLTTYAVVVDGDDVYVEM
jgi:nitrite reductase/ring-hydroxylating ferredoxin subunit